MKLESYARIDEHAKISGVALIPRISRNNNLYTKAELERFDGVTVPLNWEHDPFKEIGTVTFHYNASQETVFYDGLVVDEAAASLCRNKTLFTSIEAEPEGVREICNVGSDCFSMPFGLLPKGLALTETPGVPETTVKVIENYIRECEHHTKHPLESEIDFTKDFTKFRAEQEAIGKQIKGVMDYLELEACGDCEKLHSKKKSK